MYGKRTCTAIICSNLNALMLGVCDILSSGGELEYMYEHMATVRSLDVVNLPTISPYTTMSITRDDFPNQSKR